MTITLALLSVAGVPSEAQRLSVGSFDLTGTGSSFTSYTIFLEPALAFGADHVRMYVGRRAHAGRTLADWN